MRSILRRTVIGLAGLGLLMSGCSGFTCSGQDVRVKTSGDTLYLLARTTGVSRNLRAGLGGDAARVAARPVSPDGNMLLMQFDGCYTVRHVIVSSESDAPCVA